MKVGDLVKHSVEYIAMHYRWAGVRPKPRIGIILDKRFEYSGQIHLGAAEIYWSDEGKVVWELAADLEVISEDR